MRSATTYTHSVTTYTTDDEKDYTPDGITEIETDTEGITVIKTAYRNNVRDSVHVEYVRSANPTHDKWHQDMGYCMEKSSIEGFIFGQNGQEARFTELC